VDLIIEPIFFLWNIIFTFYYTCVRPQCDYSILGRIHVSWEYSTWHIHVIWICHVSNLNVSCVMRIFNMTHSCENILTWHIQICSFTHDTLTWHILIFHSHITHSDSFIFSHVTFTFFHSHGSVPQECCVNVRVYIYSGINMAHPNLQVSTLQCATKILSGSSGNTKNINMEYFHMSNLDTFMAVFTGMLCECGVYTYPWDAHGAHGLRSRHTAQCATRMLSGSSLLTYF